RIALQACPPHASAFGLDAGKSQCGCPSVMPTPLPLSPAATQTVTPSAAPSAMAASSEMRPSAVQESSDWPQLMLTAVGVGVAWMASVTASTNPWSVFGEKYTTCAAPDRSGYLDVEQHLPVRARRVLACHVAGTIDADGRDRGRGDTEAGEIGVQVRFRETAAELDDRDGLAGPVSPAGERVEGGDLRRGVGDGLRGGVVAAAQLGPGLRAAVQPENRD